MIRESWSLGFIQVIHVFMVLFRNKWLFLMNTEWTITSLLASVVFWLRQQNCVVNSPFQRSARPSFSLVEKAARLCLIRNNCICLHLIRVPCAYSSLHL